MTSPQNSDIMCFSGGSKAHPWQFLENLVNLYVGTPAGGLVLFLDMPLCFQVYFYEVYFALFGIFLQVLQVYEGIQFFHNSHLIRQIEQNHFSKI